MKAQVALEYIVIVGIALAIITPQVAYSWQQSEIASRIQQGEIAVNKITTSADNIYAQGPGAKTQITIYFPTGYNSTGSELLNKTIKLNVYTPAGSTDIVAVSKANLTGSLPQNSGYKLLTLEVVGGNVNITSS